jgi:hypothetical protein
MVLPWDELNNLQTKIEQTLTFEQTETGIKQKFDRDKCLDIIYDYLVYCYVMGVDNTNEQLSSSIKANDKEMRDTIYKKVAGKDYKERIEEYADNGDLMSIMKVAETEGHRDMNTASLVTANKAGARYKRWVTMNDDRVRDTHDYLEGMTVPIDRMFVTYNGDMTMFPGEFGIADEDINCRCTLSYTY